MNLRHRCMVMWDDLAFCRSENGRARDDVRALCKERNIEEYFGLCKEGQEETYLAICKEVWAKWHTTNNFKVGDKVYVHPGGPEGDLFFSNYLRATVTEVTNGKWGYHLRAFQQDLPGIYMFNIWDKDLIPRTNKSNKPLPASRKSHEE